MVLRVRDRRLLQLLLLLLAWVSCSSATAVPEVESSRSGKHGNAGHREILLANLVPGIITESVSRTIRIDDAPSWENTAGNQNTISVSDGVDNNSGIVSVNSSDRVDLVVTSEGDDIRTNSLDSAESNTESDQAVLLQPIEDKSTSNAVGKGDSNVISRVNDRVASHDFLEMVSVQNIEKRKEIPVVIKDLVNTVLHSNETKPNPDMISVLDSLIEQSSAISSVNNIPSSGNDTYIKQLEPETQTEAQSIKNEPFDNESEKQVTNTSISSLKSDSIPSDEDTDKESSDDGWELPAPIISNNPVIEIINLSHGVAVKTILDEIKPVTLTDETTEMEHIIETPISSVIVDPVTTTVKNNRLTSRRVQRSIARALMSDAIDIDQLTSYVAVEGRSANKLKKSGRRSDPEPDIDDIIQGIMQLLGGNVKIDSDTRTNTRLTTFAGGQPIISTRTNDRGPPRLPLNPFNFFNSQPSRTRPPIRKPITSPTGARPIPGRPTFVANTLPPFYATLPPELDIPRPQLPSEGGTLTAYPIPVNLIPDLSTDLTTPSSNMPESSTIFDEVDRFSINSIQPEETIVEETRIPQIPSVPIESDVIFQTEVLTTPSQINVDLINPDESSTPDNHVELEPSLSTSESSNTNEILYSTSELPIVQSTPETPSISLMSPSISIVSYLTSTTTLAQRSSTVQSSIFHIESSNTVSSRTVEVTPSYALESLTTSTLSADIPIPVSAPPRATHISSYNTKTTPLRPLRPYEINANRLRPTPPYHQRPRPGVVLDAGGYRPGHVVGGPGRPGEVFDVTVSAHQGFGGSPYPARPFQRPVPVPNYGNGQFTDGESYSSTPPLAVTPVHVPDGFVSIDGRKTYFDLFGGATPTHRPPPQTLGVGVVIPEEDLDDSGYTGGVGSVGPAYNIIPQQHPPHNTPTRQRPGYQSPHYNSKGAAPAKPTIPPPVPETPRPYKRRTTQPSIRIDTCIVGDDSTCQEQHSEVCRTEGDVSSCYCKPGTDRRRPRTKCKKMVMLEMSLKVDRVGNQRISWSGNYANPESEEYQVLEWEAKKAIDSVFSKSALNSVYLGNRIEKFYALGGNVIVNSTVRLQDNVSTRNRNIRRSLQRHIIKVIQSHGNNIGDSALWVDGPLNPIPGVDDVNECSVTSLNDCHADAVCINEFGSFTCRCQRGYTDRHRKDPARVGRSCETCSGEHCHNRGDCSIDEGLKVCKCKGSYYGKRCEVDGEVVAVAVGASVAAVIIIVLTLLFLCMWSRRWKTQDQKSEAIRRGGFLARAAAGGHYLQQKFAMGGQPQPQQYGATMEDHIRWAHMNEAALAAQQTIYGELSTMGHQGPSAQQSIYKSHRQLGGGGGGAEYGTMCPPGQYGGSQYGLQHLNPSLLQPMPPLQPSLMQQNFSSRAPSTYGQFAGPGSLTMSQSGLSRAPTVQLCDLSTAGGLSSGLETSSEEEEPRRGGGPGSCYQLPRPKSRASIGDSSDLYYELDDMTKQPHPSNDFSHFNNINTRNSNFQGECITPHNRESFRHSNPPYPSKPPPPLPRHIFNH